MGDPFRDFMSPDVDWINEPDYIRTFRELTGEAPMSHEAAWTQNTGAGYPPFINIAVADVDIVQVTVRAAAEDGKVGALARIHIPKEDWDQLLADAARLPFPGKGTDTAGEDVAVAHAQVDPGVIPPYSGSAYPTERDPLMQRTDPSLPDDHPDNEGYYARDRNPAGSHGASTGDPLGQRASADLSGRHTDPTSGDYDPINQRFIP